MALSNAQLTMLDCLIYSGFVSDDLTVGTIIDRMEDYIKAGGTIIGASMDNSEWLDLIARIRMDETLCGYIATNVQTDSSTGFCAACFVDDTVSPEDVNVVFRGTKTDYEWHDNGEGGYVSDTEQQQASAAYINGLPDSYGNYITVSGHSKGGNRAQYVTIVTDRIARCVSIDGQGFSQEFLDKYGEIIAELAGSITSISAEWDYVNCLLYPIAGSTIYIQTEFPSNPLYFHKPNLLLDENGNLNPQGQQSPASSIINQYTTYIISNVGEPLRSAMIDGLIDGVIVAVSDGKNGIGWNTILAGVAAASHVDDFIFDYIGDKYGVGAELLTTGLLAAAYPALFIDDFLHAGKELVDIVVGKMNDIAVAIGGKINQLGQNIYNLGQAFVGAVSNFMSGVREAFNRTFNRGYQIASASPYMSADTSRLRYYATRLQRVNNRIVELDGRMDRLYAKVGLRDLLKLLRADLMTGYNWRIANCEKYLNETANDLDAVERDIRNQY